MRYHGVAIDARTGLPLLPEGYFWRVSLATDSYGFHKFFVVELRKKWWLGSLLELKKTSNINRYGNVSNKERIKDTAKEMYVNWKGEDAAFNLTGDYPPKRL